MTPERWDAIVCGGGTAGPVVVSRLVQAGRRVLLLEAGPDYGSLDGGAWPPELVDSTTIPSTHDWGYVSGDELPGRTLPYERARVIGGCSAHNGCTVSWGHRADFDDWKLPGWSADELSGSDWPSLMRAIGCSASAFWRIEVLTKTLPR